MSEVNEVWLVLPQDKQIEVYRKPTNGQFTEMKIHRPGERVQSSALPEFTLDLDAFFRTEQV